MSELFQYHVEHLEVSTHRQGHLKMARSHYHDSYEIYILEDGERAYMVDGQFIHLHPRDVLLIKPDVVHCTFGGAFVRSCITFSNRYLHKFFTDDCIDSLLECFEKSVIRIRESDFATLVAFTEKLRDEEDDVFSFMQILFILKQNMERKNYTLDDSESKIATIVDYITENYKTIDNLDMLANKFFISKQHLCDLFKAYTNTSIFKYINVLKVHSASELLTKTPLSLTEIAKKSGFTSLANFSKTYKSYTGLSPLKYRAINPRNKNEGDTKKLRLRGKKEDTPE